MLELPFEEDSRVVWVLSRLRVDSIFGDGDCGVGEIHTRARNLSPCVASPRDSLTRFNPGLVA